MSFPIQFTKSHGDYDIFSPLINFTGNAAVLAVGGVGVGVITYLGLKALGFTSVAAGITAAIPVAAGAVAAAGAVISLGVTCALVAALLKGFKR